MLTSDSIVLKNQIDISDLFIFDFDGTLVNLEFLNYEALRHVTDKYISSDVDLNIYKEVATGTKSSTGIKKIFEIIGKDKNIDIEEFDYHLLAEEHRKYKRIFIQNDFDKYVKLVERADIFVEMLHGMGKKLGIASASAREFIERLLDHYKILKYFDYIVSANDVKLSKPNPESFNKVIEYFGTDKKKSIAFEDSKNGLRSAKGSGIFTVGVVCPGWNEEYVYDLSDYVIDDFSICVELMNTNI